MNRMKRTILTGLVFSIGITATTVYSFSAESFTPPHLLLKTRFSTSFTHWVISNFRNAISKQLGMDPLNYHFEKPIVFSHDFAQGIPTPDFSNTKVRKIAEDVIRSLNFRGYGSPRVVVTIDGLSYKVDDVGVDVLPQSTAQDTVEMTGRFSFRDIEMSAAKISLSLQFPRDGQYQEMVAFSLVKPEIQMPKNAPLVIGAAAKVTNQQVLTVDPTTVMVDDLEGFLVSHSQDFVVHGQMALSVDPFPVLRVGNNVSVVSAGSEYLNSWNREDAVQFLVSTYTIPPERIGDITLIMGKTSQRLLKRAGSHQGASFEIRVTDITAYLASHAGEFRTLLINEVAERLKSGFIQKVVDRLNSISVPRVFVEKNDFLAQVFALGTISGNASDRIASLEMYGAFCTPGEMKKFRMDCFGFRRGSMMIASPGKTEFDRSSRNIDRLLNSGEADMVLSVDTAYLSRMLSVAGEAGHFDSMLAPSGMFLAKSDHSVLVVADREGQEFTLYMDTFYRTQNVMQKIFSQQRYIRLPLKIRASFELEHRGGKSYAKLTLFGLDTGKKFLMYGEPQYFMRSSVQDVAKVTRGVVISTIRKKMSWLKNKVVEFEIPRSEFIPLENMTLRADGFGRVNIILSSKTRSEK